MLKDKCINVSNVLGTPQSQRMPAATDACKCVYNCKNTTILWIRAKQFMYKSVYAACSGDRFLRTFSRIILYKIENTAVAATGFFAGEVKIFDFVTERVKRCIAAIVVRYGFYILCNKCCCWGGELVKVLDYIFRFVLFDF